jgi:putative glutamine amidotransferase
VAVIRRIALLCLLCLPLQAASAFPDARPVIGVSGSNEHSRSVQFVLARLWEAGAYPVFLDHRRIAQIAEDTRYLDGVIIGGNRWDINPADYGDQTQPRTDNEDDTNLTESDDPSLRGDYEYALLDQVFAQNIAFLGICSGMQRLNVHQHSKDGGRLIQHVDGQQQYSPESFNPARPSDEVRVMAQTKLRQFTDEAEFAENSIHHQAIDPAHLRRGFRISALSVKDGRNTVEAIEPDPKGPYASLPVIGVQWHPEYGITALSRHLFDRLVAQARTRMNTTPDDAQAIEALDTLSDETRALIERGPEHLHELTGWTPLPQ